jgi:hypothetical protein
MVTVLELLDGSAQILERYGHSATISHNLSLRI